MGIVTNTKGFDRKIFADFEQQTRPIQAFSFLQFLLTLSKTGETLEISI
jgi:hypothetical protein